MPCTGLCVTPVSGEDRRRVYAGSMEHFLRGCRAALQKKDGDDFHVVLGNEACDLDSMVSAIALAYFLSKTSSSKNLVHIPVLNIPREDFPLRTECGFFLRENGISEELLTFRDEVDLTELYDAGQLSLSLVDHNVLPRSDSFMEDVVTQVIDHHILERRPSASCPVTLELVGSCTTLVAEKIVQEAPQILDFQLASLLRGTIVLDCVNMAPAAGKVTPKDTEYVAILESKFPDLPPRGSVFDSLQNSKFDVSGLSTDQMLRKDLKALTSRDVSLAVSAIYMHIWTNRKEFLQRDGLERDLQAFCQKYDYNVLVAMAITFTAHNEPIRQIAVYSQQGELRDLVSRALEEARSPPLDLSPSDGDPCHHVTAYRQGNTAASRKKVLPILKELLRSSDSSCCPMQASQEAEDSNGQSGFHERSAGNHFEAAEFPPDDGDYQDEMKGRGYRARFRKQFEDGFEDEKSFPPTPMNSLVEGCPLDRGLPKLTVEAILERISRITVGDSEGNLNTGSQSRVLKK
ncbi:PREDICTED: protein prune homolog [Nanorana parkeri]|uniref:protein prune homolog n=1 Tax=Nanorana parkeri TaxID=125878 RepID=UPI000854ACBC|nr:PREDICTED: protein prune homolog [Nanorana parkeri]